MKLTQTVSAAALVSLYCLSASAENQCKGVPASVPQVQHVFVVVEENQSYDDIIGNPNMPYLNQLAAHGGLARGYYANTHPSLNDYFYLTSGHKATRRPGGLADLFDGRVSGENIASILKRHGKTWKAYAEDLPSVGYLGGNTELYVKRHNPFVFYKNIVEDRAPSGTNQRDQIVPFARFAADWRSGVLPSYSFIIPNLINDAHTSPRTHRGSGCGEADSLRQADQWLEQNLKPVIEAETFHRDSLLIIVFDEACDQGNKADHHSSPSRSNGGGGHIAGILVGANIPANGCVSDTLLHHESVFRLSLKALGINEFPSGAADAADMGMFFEK